MLAIYMSGHYMAGLLVSFHHQLIETPISYNKYTAFECLLRQPAVIGLFYCIAPRQLVQ